MSNICFIKNQEVLFGRWLYSGQRPGFDPLICAGHLFRITAESPKTTQIAAILSSDGTYNVYMHLRL